MNTATFTPADFVLSCMERGYLLQNKNGVLSFAPPACPPAKVREYLESHQAQIAAYWGGSVPRTCDSAPVVPPDVINEFNEFNAAPAPGIGPLCASALAIFDSWDWESLLNALADGYTFHHITELSSRLRLSQDSLQTALDYLIQRGAVRKETGYPGATCRVVINKSFVEVPAVFYAGWPGTLSLSEISEESPDALMAAASSSASFINVSASDAEHSQKGLF